MFTIYYRPHPALEEYVETICIMGHEFVSGDLLSPIYTFMPAHTRFMCLYLEDLIKGKNDDGDFKERPRCMIIGPQLTPVTLDLGKKYTNVIVMFKPCGLYRLLGIPLKEIVDLDCDGCLIFGKEINELVDRLMDTSSSERRNDVIQEYLLKKLIKLKAEIPMDRAMLQFVRSQGKISMDRLASQSCVSVRQLERQSLERIGYSPKLFARVVRFSESYKFKQRNPHTPWTQIAHRFGYYDQMHLIRDFRFFTGFNPSMVTEEEILHSVLINSIER